MDGLSSSQVYNMFQDKNGDMFFATDRGITKYDGYKFETFSRSDGITNTTVFKFFPQSDGNIWCSTIDNSWFYFKNGTTEFKACSANPIIQKNSIGGLIESMHLEANGDMYFGFIDVVDYLKLNIKTKKVDHPAKRYLVSYYDSLTAVFVKLKTGNFNYISYGKDLKKIWSNRAISTTSQSRLKNGYKRTAQINNHFLFSTHKHVIISDGNRNNRELEFNSQIIGLGKYDNSHFWIGFLDGGVKVIDFNGKVISHILRNESATDLFIDKNGGIWISTLVNGVFYAQNDFIKFHDTGNSRYIFSISPGKKRFPLVSTLKEHYQFYFQDIKKDNLGANNLNRKIYFDQSLQDYYFTIEASQIIDNRDMRTSPAIIDFSETQNTPTLISSPYNIYFKQGNKFLRYYYKERIKAIEIAKNGFLIGEYNGLYFFNRFSEKKIKINHSALNGRISDIKLMGKYYFIGTNESGLVRYDQSSKQFLNIKKSDGLSSDLINEVYPESENVVWVATSFGFDRITFSGKKFRIKHFGMEHGLKDNDVTDIYVFNDQIWIGTRSGLFSISKKDFESKAKSIKLNLFWKNTQLNNRKMIYPNKFELSHDENNFELEFHSAFFGGVGRVKYRYKLIGSKDIWHSVKGRTIVFNNLQPGSYNLILQANVDETNWTENQLYSQFVIHPPFYKTLWFRSLILALGAFLIYLFFKFRVLIYNKSLVREFLRLLIRKLNPRQHTFVIVEQGQSHRINSNDILFLKSEGNYLQIQLIDGKFTIRGKIGEFEDLVPDKIEFLRVHKSYVVRIDKITGKNIDVIFLDKIEIPIGKTYKAKLKELTV